MTERQKMDTDASGQHPSPRRKWIQMIIMAGVLLLVVGACLWNNRGRSGVRAAVPTCGGTVGIRKGQCAPDFSLPVLQKGQSGRKVSLSEFLDKPTVLYFFRTNCAECVDHMPVMEQIQNRYQDRINFLYMDLSNREPNGVEGVQEFLSKSHPATGQPMSIHPVLLGDRNQSIIYDIALMVPALCLIDTNGHIVDASTQVGNEVDIENRLQGLIAVSSTSSGEAR
ncbi:peroxiredoxin family protein [Pasteuria penetrans]|uniref:peroxiredoxin family protein n=1 Tax=Pasteuria penetrans TaxID=86005 RepID=UPI000F95D627|nr:TlpA disulfide reductase family protein [Pasteuria penetrans]